MKYLLSIPNPSSKYIEIEILVENISSDKICFQLPSWRQGRYELGNFAKNIQRWNVFDEKGAELNFNKITKDRWEVETRGNSKIFVRYNYFASQLDAGGCWLDSAQLYVNPVHCCLFVEDKMNEPCEMELKIPERWQIACGMKMKGPNILFAENYHQLVDSPFIASPSLKHHGYDVNKIPFHIWMQGECNPDWTRIEKDFKAFTQEQINLFDDFPGSQTSTGYHFLIQVLPYNFYHGVEHTNSTVLAIGPGNELMTDKIYNELIGVASHELFHVWNVKTIRPADMFPYDYTKENYSRLGFVYEGFTTYYGDLFLARTGFFNLDQYLKEISIRFQKHMDNYGRFNYSVAQSSFDTWLDGYVRGVPNRKTSIYDEGSLIALMLDLMIRKSTGSKKSLDDVMRKLNNDFGKKKVGYTEKDIENICADMSGRSMKKFFDDYVYKAASYDSLLEELLSYAGLEIKRNPSLKTYESVFGFKTDYIMGSCMITRIAPESPAYHAGLSVDDEIIFVNNTKVENNLDALCGYSNDNEITLGVFTLKRFREVKIPGKYSAGKTFYDNYSVVPKEKPTDEEKKFLKEWIKTS